MRGTGEAALLPTDLVERLLPVGGRHGAPGGEVTIDRRTALTPID